VAVSDDLGRDTQLLALQALRLVAAEYGLTNLKKPCLAFVLDGNIGGAARHQAAYIVAISCREMGLSEAETERVLVRWARKIGYSPQKACRAIANAFAKLPGGEYRYFPPGLTKRPGSVAFAVLAPICAEVGCPANCPAYMGLGRGPGGETFGRFMRLRWPEGLRRVRHDAAIDWYRAVCLLEEERGFAAGALLRTSTRQLSVLAGRDRRHACENLELLCALGLLARFVRGSGSNPRAADRQASELARKVPIPAPPAELLLPAIQDRGRLASSDGGRPAPKR
jgi:hypothetical protein